MTDTSRHEEQPHLHATPARQGRMGRSVFWVLVFGTLLAALGLLVAWTWKAPALTQAEHQRSTLQAAGSRAFDAPNPPAAQPSPKP